MNRWPTATIASDSWTQARIVSVPDRPSLEDSAGRQLLINTGVPVGHWIACTICPSCARAAFDPMDAIMNLVSCFSKPKQKR